MNRREPSAFALLMAEVQALPLDTLTRERFMALFRAAQGQRVTVSRRELARADQVAHARRLLALGERRALVRDRLMALHGISRRRAYVVIEMALEDGPRG